MTKLIASAVVAAAMGLGLGLWLHARAEPQLILCFEEPEIDLRGSPAVEGEPIKVVGKLHNRGKVPVLVTNIKTCCGLKLDGPSEGDHSRFSLDAGASIPVPLRIDTALVSGELLGRAQVEGQTEDGTGLAPADLIISYRVQSPLVAYPAALTLTVNQEDLSSPVKQTVLLADLWPGDGLPIKSITSTLSDKLHYQLVPTRGEAWIGSRLLNKRYDLELGLILDKTKPAFDHTVTITPDHPKAKPVEVRLTGKVIPRCGLDADSIGFAGKTPGERLVRQVDYRYRDPADREVRVVKAPPWLSVSISEVRDGLKVVTLNCTLPEYKGVRMEEVCFEFGRDKQRAALSLVVSCAAGPQR